MTSLIVNTPLRIFVPRQEDCELVDWLSGGVDRFLEYNSSREEIAWVNTPEEADLVILFEKWGPKFWAYLTVLNKCPLYTQNKKKIVTINCDCLVVGFLPGCYVSLTSASFNRRNHRNIPYPMEYTNAVPAMNPGNHKTVAISPLSYDDEHEDVCRKYLFSYRGSTWSHPLRKRMVEILGECKRGLIVPMNDGFGNHGEDARVDYVNEIKQSKFVLCPRGTGPSSFRLFEAMELSRCPVIISDDWLRIPGIPWDECAIFVKERDVAQIPKILAERESDAEHLGLRAREIWEANFAPEPRARRILDDAIAVWRDLQAEPFDVDAYHRSWRFYYAIAWSIPHRLRSRVKREFAALFTNFQRKMATQ